MSDRDVDGRRPRILIGAYHAAIDEGPEAGAGWAFATAAARAHDVWVITRRRFEEKTQAALAADPELGAHLRVVYLDLPDRIMRHKRSGLDLYWYYALWQRALGRRARELDREIGFDVAHHVTFANDWLPCGLTALNRVPLIWGPVGGASTVPIRRLARWLGLRGALTEVTRDLLTRLPRRVWGDRAARRAAVVVAQNPEVAERFSRARRVIVEPNAALDELAARGSTQHPPGTPDATAKTAVFAGRLVAWKGARLAIETLTHPSVRNWNLEIYGSGYQRAALERQVHRLGLQGRVEFKGHRPRPELLDAFERADALFFPSMHDQAGWVAAEASSLGCPVVCLPLGGPQVLAHTNAQVAPLEGDLIANLAHALHTAGSTPGVRHDRWSRDRLPELLEGWYADAMSTSS